MRQSKRYLLLSTVSLMLAGCNMIPDYLRPDFSAANSWTEVQGYHLKNGDSFASDMDWKEFYDSSEIHLLVGTALQSNKDLKTAALNIDEARTIYRVNRADLFPSINAGASATLSHSSDESSATGRAAISRVYEAQLGLASYELDLFGRIRSTNESALNDYLATEEAYAIVRSALIAETTNAYLQYLADQKLLSLTKKTLDAQLQTYRILKESLDKGVSTKQDVARAATSVETARVNLHRYNRLVSQDTNALFLLMGIPYDSEFLPKTTLDEFKLEDKINAGLPSEVLLSRPDIRQAEYSLLASNADIGAARAAFFPSINLTGAYGYASRDLANLFSGSAWGAWSFIPQLTLPIFNGGANIANLDLAKIRKEQAVVDYERAIQEAFSDVSNELVARSTLDKELKAQRRLVNAAQQVYDISQARYKAGIDSFLDVLDAQRELYTYQQNEIEIERQRMANLVNLYAALGGGAYDTPLKHEE